MQVRARGVRARGVRQGVRGWRSRRKRRADTRARIPRAAPFWGSTHARTHHGRCRTHARTGRCAAATACRCRCRRPRCCRRCDEPADRQAEAQRVGTGGVLCAPVCLLDRPSSGDLGSEAAQNQSPRRRGAALDILRGWWASKLSRRSARARAWTKAAREGRARARARARRDRHSRVRGEARWGGVRQSRAAREAP